MTQGAHPPVVFADEPCFMAMSAQPPPEPWFIGALSVDAAPAPAGLAMLATSD